MTTTDQPPTGTVAAYKEGRNAASRFERRVTCPHVVGPLRDAWLRGFDHEREAILDHADDERDDHG